MEIALYKPEIPPNTGNISRLSVCTGSRLHIIGKPSFSMDEASVRRAGLDYWDRLDLHLHEDWDEFLKCVSRGRCESRTILLLSKYGNRPYVAHRYERDDILVFGRETSGLPDFILKSIGATHPERILRIPVVDDCRSLNLSNAVAVVLYEALRQQDFVGLKPSHDG